MTRCRVALRMKGPMEVVECGRPSAGTYRGQEVCAEHLKAFQESDAKDAERERPGCRSAHAPPIRTDDNNPLAKCSAQWGVDFSTRKAIKDREKEGIIVANRKDDEHAARVHRTAPTEMLREQVRREEQAERIRIG